MVHLCQSVTYLWGAACCGMRCLRHGDSNYNIQSEGAEHRPPPRETPCASNTLPVPSTGTTVLLQFNRRACFTVPFAAVSRSSNWVMSYPLDHPHHFWRGARGPMSASPSCTSCLQYAERTVPTLTGLRSS
jgi:hypothetical protein